MIPNQTMEERARSRLTRTRFQLVDVSFGPATVIS
jgi:hypothetical protein